MFSNIVYVTYLVLFVVRDDVFGQEMEKMMTYLGEFGYMEGNRTMSEAIKMLQKEAGLERTGEMNEEVEAVIEIPRCGALIGAFQGSRWRVKNIAYNVVNYPPYLDAGKVDEVIREAFSEWTKLTGIRFKQAKKIARLNIEFSTSGVTQAGTIAGVAKFPINGGHITLNKDIRWTIERNGTAPGNLSLHQVMLHEIGHSLGLHHSSYANSVMMPFLGTNELHIHPSDERRIKILYDEYAEELFHQMQSSQEPSVCRISKISGIIAYKSDLLYVFNESEYWLLDAWTSNIEFSTKKYPMKIRNWWKDGPETIDTVFVDIDNTTYFFKGALCWQYLGGADNLAPGFPKRISEEFPGIPDDIDAVMTWSNNKTYFFKGSDYWRFDRKAVPQVPSDYPKPISTWGDIPNDLDAALYFHQYNEDTFFFKDMRYYKYEQSDGTLIRGYPRNTAFWWFNC